MERVIVALFALISIVASEQQACSPDKLTVYQVVVNTFWTRDKFPKHYPDWRPPAQWTKSIGRTHDDSFSLFRLGEKASAALKVFAENGRSEQLDALSQSKNVLDEFTAPPITSGAGTVNTTFFADGNHSKVSLITRIVPSPDWFIGIDSFNLCVNGNWIDSVTIELDPIDAGTDNGFTFTAPNWITDPQGVVYRITHTYPHHPAGSFYYPFAKRLPAIATFQFIKLREYELTEQFKHEDKSKNNYEIIRMEHISSNNIDDNNVEEEQEVVRSPLLAKMMPNTTTTTTTSKPTTTSPTTTTTTMAPLLGPVQVGVPLQGALPRGDKEAIIDDIVNSYDKKRRRSPRKKRPRRDCRVSEWGPWGECSTTCGIGEMQRHRKVEKHARRGGTPCPPLLETRWCGSARTCSKKYFDWRPT